MEHVIMLDISTKIYINILMGETQPLKEEDSQISVFSKAFSARIW